MAVTTKALTDAYYTRYVAKYGDFTFGGDLNLILRDSVLEKIRWCRDECPPLKGVLVDVFGNDTPTPRQFVVCVHQGHVDLFMDFMKHVNRVDDPMTAQVPRYLLMGVLGSLGDSTERLRPTFYALLENALGGKHGIYWDSHYKQWFGPSVITNLAALPITYGQLWEIMLKCLMLFPMVCYK
jgi:hypothetical protein